jgi:hypothetical protein
MSRLSFALPLLALVVLLPLGAQAKLCGDDVQGRDVPCDCGDTVVSDLILDNDPVTQTVCEHDGLIVRAVDAGHGVTVDLRGHTLRGGMHGAGVRVLHGGPGGARIVSTGGHATIEGFDDGIFGRGDAAVALVEGILARNNHRDGIRVVGSDYEIRNSEAVGSGRHGFSLGGKGFRLSSTRAIGSKRSGYFVIGENGTLGRPGAGLVAEANGEFGFNLMGMGHHVVECVASGAGKDGIMVMGMQIEIRGCTLARNGGNGIGGMGGVMLVSNRALNNDKNGIDVSGPDARDGGGNRGSGNRGLGTNVPPVDCRIRRLPCYL